MKKSFFFILIMFFLVTELSIFAGIKIERFALNFLPIGQYPWERVLNESPYSTNMSYTNDDSKLIFYRVLNKHHLNNKWIVVDQINLQISKDTCKNWNTIYQSPLDEDIQHFNKDFIYSEAINTKPPLTEKPISLNVINSRNIQLSGTDSTGFIISFYKQTEDKWEIIANIRFQSDKFRPKELMSIDENESFCILENQENHSYLILKSNDSWRTNKEVYVSKYSTNFNNPNLEPELKFLRKNQNRIKDDLIVFKHQFENELIITDKDFKELQIIDFIDNQDIINLRVLNDSILYVITQEQKDKDVIYSIQKSTDKGKSWIEIFTEKNNKPDPYFDFKIKDENNFLIRGDLLTDPIGNLYKTKFTTDAGRTWNYLFNDIDPYYNAFAGSVKSLMTISEYNTDARFFQWDWMIKNPYAPSKYWTLFCEYFANNILYINCTHPMTTDTSTYPKKFRLNEEYGFRCQECTFHDTEAPWFINYLLIKPNEKEMDLPSLSLINGVKLLYREDTLKWQKIEGATKYNVRIFKTGIFYPHVFDFLLDTTVTENFLATPNLQKGYGYVFSARAENETEKGRYSVFYASETADALSLLKPKFLAPQFRDTLNNIGRPDSVHFGELKLEWEAVPNAKYYMLYVYEDTIGPVIQVGSVQRGGTTITKPVVIAEYLKDTKYSYKYMKRDRIYQVTVWAENEIGISPAKTVYYALSDENSVIEINNSNILIFPNPASDRLTLSNIPEGAVGYDIYDLFGSRLLSTPSSLRDATPQEGNWEIDVSKLSPGIYFIKIGTQPPLKFVKIN